jgi:dUTP diphosphatase
MEIKIKKIHVDAKIPEYAKEGDAGMDVYAISKEENDKFVQYGTGLTFELPPGHVMLIFSRSNVTKKDLMLKNSVGVLDSGYRGELVLRFNKFGRDHYEIGERIGQIMILPHPKIQFNELKENEELDDSERGEGGFGSTGLN